MRNIKLVYKQAGSPTVVVIMKQQIAPNRLLQVLSIIMMMTTTTVGPVSLYVSTTWDNVLFVLVFRKTSMWTLNTYRMDQVNCVMCNYCTVARTVLYCQ